MRGLILALLLLAPLAWAWTGVAGDCAEGDYTGALSDVLNAAPDEGTVNVIVCGEHALRWSEVLRGDDMNIVGGTIRSEEPQYIKIVAGRIWISDVNLQNVFLVLQAEEVYIKDVNIGTDFSYCLKISADRAEINGIYVDRCMEGIVGDVNTLVLARLGAGSVDVPVDVDTKSVVAYPIERIVERTRIVEVNRACPPCECEPCDVSAYALEVRRLRGELDDCESRLVDCENNVSALLAEMKEMETPKGGPVPDVAFLAALAALGLGVGFLLGRL